MNCSAAAEPEQSPPSPLIQIGANLMIDVSAKRFLGPVIRLHPGDNVVVARTEGAMGTPVPSEGFVLRSQALAGYKIAARDLRKGEPILKYNVVVGFAAKDI